MRKVVFISNFYFPVMGGIEQNIHKISSYLADRYLIEILVRKKQNPNLKKETNGIKTIGLSAYGYLKRDYSDTVVVITNFSILPNFIVMLNILISRNKPRMVILVPHGGLTLDWSQFGFLTMIIKKTYNKMLGMLLIKRTVNKIIAVSKWEKDELKKLNLGVEINIIRNGIDQIGNSRKKSKEKYVLYLGRIKPIKNIEGAIDIFASLIKIDEFADYNMRIVGNQNLDPEYTKLLKSKILSDNLTGKVKFYGEKISSEKINIIRNAKVLICVSHWENDPIVIKEAFSCGTKVIITNKYGLNDFYDEVNAITINKENFDIKMISNFMNKPFTNKFKNKLETWEEVSLSYEKLFS